MLHAHTLAAKPVTFLSSARAFLLAQNWAAILVIVILVVAIRLPIDYKRIMTPTDNDYGSHIYFALDMLHGREVQPFTLAHSFWQLALIGIYWISRSRIDFWQSAIGLQVLSSVASALIVYFWFGYLKTRPSPWVRVFWAVTLVIVTPVVAPYFLNGLYYSGYIGLANYHNPTVHMLRPFALLMTIAAFQVLDRPGHSWWSVAFVAAATAGATFLKPSFTITLLPALGLIVLYRLVRRVPLDWRLLIFGLGIPAVLFLVPQYAITYIQGETDGGIALMPLAAASAISNFLLVKFFLSIFFPLVILILFFKKMRQDPEMILAWLAFGVGAAQFYLLAELGSRFEHGNFLWGAQITLFILFVATIRFLLKQDKPLAGLLQPRVWAPYAVYLPHVVSGVAYYLYCYVNPFTR
jgi:hypothetical protein